jgi:hypothetical protein
MPNYVNITVKNADLNQQVVTVTDRVINTDLISNQPMAPTDPPVALALV